MKPFTLFHLPRPVRPSITDPEPRSVGGVLTFCTGVFLLLLSSAVAAEPTAAQVEFFENKIRPVLAESCYECHNSIDKKKGDVALDYRAALLESEVIVPGDPEASLLMASIRHEEGFEAMPDKAPKLSTLTLRHFEQWIRMGAPDPRIDKPTKEELASQIDWNAVRDQRSEWWSFQPLQDPAVPEIADAEWSRSAIDRFVFTRLEKSGLSPQSPAPPEVLVRRLHLVLTGLPPEPEVVDAFAANPTAAAYEDLVDTLLASPAFGERWGRYWLDWFRYAESHGSEGDPPVPHPTVYRDYVIRALNADVPYDQLLREAVAGDLLEGPRINEELGINESAIGPGHFRMVPHGFGVTDAYDEQITFTDNQIDVLTKSTMGVTLSCARCHNHKFDPLSQADFYKLYGIMISSRPAVINVDSPAQQAKNRDQLQALKPAIREAFADWWLGDIDTAIAALADTQNEALKKAAARDESHPFHAWLHLRTKKDELMAREWRGLHQRHQERLQQKQERIASATFYADLREQETYDRWFKNGTGLRDEVSPAGSFAVAAEGTAALTGIYPRGIYTHLLTDKDNATLGSVFHVAEGAAAQIHAIGSKSTGRLAVRSYPLMHGGLHPALEFSDSWQWLNQKKYSYWNGERVFFQLSTGPDQTFRTGSGRAWFGVTEVYGGDQALPAIGVPAVALPGAPDTVSDRGSLLAHYRRSLTEALRAWRKGNVSDAQAVLIDAFRHYGLLPVEMTALPATLRADIERYRELEAEIREPVRAPGVIEGQPWDQPLLVQGNYRNEEDPIERGFLEVFGGDVYSKQHSGRRELAEDLVGEGNTLTTRVIVNRLWHHVFGSGLVASTDNFGRLGKEPTHPRLLDHLAVQFRDDDGWSIKKTIRRLVTSRAFRSASQAPAAAAEKDPGNLLLSYYSPRRLDAEAIQDTIRFVSGSLGERAVYRRQKRNSLDPFLTAFNLPIPTTTVGVRDSTNVPAQSLMLLNSAEANNAAKRWSERILRDRELLTDEARITRLFQQGYSRRPSEVEMNSCLTFLHGKSADDSIPQLIESVQAARDQLTALALQRDQQVKTVRERLQAAADARNASKSKDDPSPTMDLKPISQWDFETDTRDQVGSLHGEIVGDARIEDGALVLDGGCVFTAPLNRDVKAKTLEVLVQLDRLDQRAGGAMTLQTLDGVTFDSVVYAEIAKGEWLTGSNNHTRTLPFGGPAEVEADQRPVRLILVYEDDGTTRAYRDGKPYGKPIRKKPLQAFASGKTQVAFGLRHGTGPGGNRALTGKIFEARLYDRALSPGEAAAASSGRLMETVTSEQVLAALDPTDRKKVVALDRKIATARTALAELERQLAAEQRKRGNLSSGLARLAHAILNSKELIYVY